MHADMFVLIDMHIIIDMHRSFALLRMTSTRNPVILSAAKDLSIGLPSRKLPAGPGPIAVGDG